MGTKRTLNTVVLRKKGTPFVFRTKAPAESDIKKLMDWLYKIFLGKPMTPPS
jgi:hypothetical protein